MKYVVINADDLGISLETNTAVLKAFRDGILTSTSVMPAMPAFPDALERVAAPNPELGIGLHLSLTGGMSIALPDEIPLLVDETQVFRHGFGGIRRLLGGRSREAALEQIERELDAQFAAIEAAGIAWDHVDSHQYVHMIPDIWNCVVRLAQTYRCPVIRLADERLRLKARSFGGMVRACGRFNLAKKLLLSHWSGRNRRILDETQEGSQPIRAADHFVGVLDSGRMDAPALGRVLRSLPDGVTEIVMHPGLGTATRDGNGSNNTAAPVGIHRADHQFLQSDNRRAELAALLDDDLRRMIDESGAQRARFRDCFQAPCEAAAR